MPDPAVFASLPNLHTLHAMAVHPRGPKLSFQSIAGFDIKDLAVTWDHLEPGDEVLTTLHLSGLALGCNAMRLPKRLGSTPKSCAWDQPDRARVGRRLAAWCPELRSQGLVDLKVGASRGDISR